MLLCFEGIDGSGKSTLMRYANNYLMQQSFNVIQTHEPGGTILANKIRALLLNDNNDDEPIYNTTETLLFFAARYQHIREIIIPALQQNKVVLIDRFIDSSYAYQVGGRGMPLSLIHISEPTRQY